MSFEQAWGVSIQQDDKGVWVCSLVHYESGIGSSVISFERYGSSSTLFLECMSALDASIFTSLAIAEGVLPEGQLPLH